MKEVVVFQTYEVIEWGLKNYYTSADRVKRILMEEGKIRKLTPLERMRYGIKSKEAAYKLVVNKDKQFDFSEII